MRCVVMWFRRDLRLADHPALEAAASTGLAVVPLFVVDPAFAAAGAPRRAYMNMALRSLDRSMDDALVYRNGDPVDVVPRFASEVGAESVFVTRDFGPYGRTRDATVSERLRADGRALIGRGSPYAVAPGSVVKDDGSPYAMFTPFLKRWRAHAIAAQTQPPTLHWLGAPSIACDGRPSMVGTECALPEVGEAAADERWSSFSAALARPVRRATRPTRSRRHQQDVGRHSLGRRAPATTARRPCRRALHTTRLRRSSRGATSMPTCSIADLIRRGGTSTRG